MFAFAKTCTRVVHGTNGIYRNARADGTIQVPPDVPNRTDANYVLNVLTG
jgi:hypothetical protein